MKNSFITLALVFSLNSFASIADLETRHLILIKNTIQEKCGNFKNLVVTNVEKKEIYIDQGIVDAEYLVILNGEQRLDQNIFDPFKITVKSEYADMYDHSSKEWGAYFVKSVKCEML